MVGIVDNHAYSIRTEHLSFIESVQPLTGAFGYILNSRFIYIYFLWGLDVGNILPLQKKNRLEPFQSIDTLHGSLFHLGHSPGLNYSGLLCEGRLLDRIKTFHHLWNPETFDKKRLGEFPP